MNTGLRMVLDESPTRRLLASLFEHVSRGFTEAGCPLSHEQQQFLDDAIALVGR